MLCLSGFELYSRWVLLKDKDEKKEINKENAAVVYVGSLTPSGCSGIHKL